MKRHELHSGAKGCKEGESLMANQVGDSSCCNYTSDTEYLLVAARRAWPPNRRWLSAVMRAECGRLA